jgi:hypothetical protein
MPKRRPGSATSSAASASLSPKNRFLRRTGAPSGGVTCTPFSRESAGVVPAGVRVKALPRPPMGMPVSMGVQEMGVYQGCRKGLAAPGRIRSETRPR